MHKSSSLGMSPGHSKKYPRGSSVKAWGCPRHPLFINKKHQVIFQCTIFLLLHALCVILGASLFLLCVYFVCLFVQYSWIPSCLLWSETRSDVLHIYLGVRHAVLYCIMFTLE